MKKFFLSLMLVAAVAACFTSCKKNTNESETHSQTFTLGETQYSVDNAITIANMQYDGSDIYNAIVLSQGQMIGDTGGEGRGIAIVFKGNINAGTYNLSENEEYYPKYVFANLEVEDIVNFNIEELDDEDAYYAVSGAFTLEINDGVYTITTDNINVRNAQDPAISESSSIDFEGTPSRYVMANVTEGTINEDNIVTAGVFKYTFPLIGEQKIAAFITETGDAMGFFYSGETIPVGDISTTLIYLEEMNIKQPQSVPNANIIISVANNVYTVDIANVTIQNVDYSLHYVGEMPYFDFPF